jgi:hypothetical protein
MYDIPVPLLFHFLLNVPLLKKSGTGIGTGIRTL